VRRAASAPRDPRVLHLRWERSGAWHGADSGTPDRHTSCGACTGSVGGVRRAASRLLSATTGDPRVLRCRLEMTVEQLAVADTNEAFYRAISSGDFAAMEELWFPAEWAECVHPGWTSLRGWEAVRDSWKMLFDS